MLGGGKEFLTKSEIWLLFLAVLLADCMAIKKSLSLPEAIVRMKEI